MDPWVGVDRRRPRPPLLGDHRKRTMDSDDNADIDNADTDRADIDRAEMARLGDNVDDQTVEQATEQQSTEDDDLRESLEGLSRLASSRLPLEGLLTQVATYTVRAIPGGRRRGFDAARAGQGRHDRGDRSVRY
jgi:hypothetical protein